MSINSFNRKFNSACSRMAFWNALYSQLSAFDTLLKSARNLTPDDAAALKAIHKKLYECYGLTKKRLQIHSHRIYSLRKEFHNNAQS